MMYVGYTEDLKSRLKSHNKGSCRFTKGHKPWEIVYTEEFNTKGEAMKRESFFKTGVGRQILKKYCGMV